MARFEYIAEEKTTVYIRQLDGLRALAVILVVVSHYLPKLVIAYFISGRTGVLLFFMISGYLITRILLDCKEKARGDNVLLLHVWKRFFQRRILRIFPLYYAVLVVMFIFGLQDVRQFIWWHAAYLTNFLIAGHGNWFINISHFWSLAVEEQFYIFWPLVVLFMPLRFICILLISFLIVGPSFRLMMMFVGEDEIAPMILPFSVVDSLGLGALFGYLTRMKVRYIRKLSLCLSCLGFILAGFFSGLYFPLDENFFVEKAGQVLYDTIVILSASGLFIYTLQLKNGLMISMLTFKPLIYLGKISYGIYILHIPVMNMSWMLFELFDRIDLYNSLSKNQLAMLWSLLTLLASVLSWHFFENKINSLKRHFPYFPKPKVSSVCATVKG